MADSICRYTNGLILIFYYFVSYFQLHCLYLLNSQFLWLLVLTQLDVLMC